MDAKIKTKKYKFLFKKKKWGENGRKLKIPHFLKLVVKKKKMGAPTVFLKKKNRPYSFISLQTLLLKIYQFFIFCILKHDFPKEYDLRVGHGKADRHEQKILAP